jgi:hypothetical protein
MRAVFEEGLELVAWLCFLLTEALLGPIFGCRLACSHRTKEEPSLKSSNGTFYWCKKCQRNSSRMFDVNVSDI